MLPLECHRPPVSAVQVSPTLVSSVGKALFFPIVRAIQELAPMLRKAPLPLFLLALLSAFSTGCASSTQGEDLASKFTPVEANARVSRGSDTPRRSSRNLTAGPESAPRENTAARATPRDQSARVNSKGWDFAAQKLLQDGVSIEKIAEAFGSPAVPPFENVPFALKPKESHQLYRGATTPSMVAIATDGIRRYSHTFDAMERKYGVDRGVVAAILTIESRFGSVTGSHPVFYRLLRLVSTNDPQNVRWNFSRLREEDASVEFADVKARGDYLEQTFYPELLALFEICARESLRVTDLKGSIAGAFGIPQFMPRSYLAFSVDGNGNGRISLFEKEDAIMSVGHFLSQHGWGHQATPQQKRRAIWGYNKSDAYINAVLTLASLSERSLTKSPPRKQTRYEPLPSRPAVLRAPSSPESPQEPRSVDPYRDSPPPTPRAGKRGATESKGGDFLDLEELY